MSKAFPAESVLRMLVQADVRDRDGYACTKCGMTQAEHFEKHGIQLHVHRVVPQSDYTLEGCVTMCVTCHQNTPHSTRTGATMSKAQREQRKRELGLLV